MSTKKTNQKKVAKATEVEKLVVVEQSTQPSQPSQITEIKVAEIIPNPANPRKYFDEESLSELAQNILEQGVLQPITVREVSEENGKKYEIVFGERRFRAAKNAGLETIPCIVATLPMKLLSTLWCLKTCKERIFDRRKKDKRLRQFLTGDIHNKMIKVYKLF